MLNKKFTNISIDKVVRNLLNKIQYELTILISLVNYVTNNYTLKILYYKNYDKAKKKKKTHTYIIYIHVSSFQRQLPL